MNKHYLIYQITNNVNGKIYIGKHETFNVDDDYFGSGKYLKRAIKKYGLENFTKTILIDLNNAEEMNLLETLVVNIEFLKRNDIYNLKPGGIGGFKDKFGNNIAKGIKHLNPLSKIRHSLAAKGRKHTLKQNKAHSIAMTGKKQNNEQIQKRVMKNKGQKRTIKQRLRMSAAQIGRKISKESVEKQIKTKLKNNTLGIGSSNPNYGNRTLISQTGEKIKVKMFEVQLYLDKGYKYTNPKWYRK